MLGILFYNTYRRFLEAYREIRSFIKYAIQIVKILEEFKNPSWFSKKNIF